MSNQIVVEMTREGANAKTRAHSFFPPWVQQRELRHRLPLGHSDALYKRLYTTISPCHSWVEGGSPRSEHGGLHSLDFSPDGTHLVAGCENSFQIFDPLSRRLTRTVPNAHTGSVTHIKFLDSRIFATGGHDGKVSLWDTRYLKSRFRTLLGHSDSIGNIEFARKTEMLITSALDGISCIWDMKNWKQTENLNSTFMSYVLLRLRLYPNETKMIISTANGYLLIVHELDLNRLAQDLGKFELETSEFDYLHERNCNSCQNSSRYLRRNRCRNSVEIVADFPNNGDNNVISALEMHPLGWSAFSRSKNEASGQEWTCVHSLQEREPCADEEAPREGLGVKGPPCPQRLARINEEQCSTRGEWESTERASVRFCMRSSNESVSELPDAALSFERGVFERTSDSLEIARVRSPLPGPSSATPHPLELAGLGSNPDSSRVQDPSLYRSNPIVAEFNQRVNQRFPRLSHYMEESYSSEWYISSMGVSADGRLVCSPLESGIRLLAFSPECSEQSMSWSERQPRRLHELSTSISHTDIVLCTKFSPRHCLVVSGCIDGKLAWYQPIV